MKRRESIASFVYIALYTLALVLFFFCGGTAGNNWVLFLFAHVYCICAIIINSRKKIGKLLLQSFAVYMLLTNILWVAEVSCIWPMILFFITGIYHSFLLDDCDLFGNLSEIGVEENSLESGKFMVAIALSLFAWVIFFFTYGA